MRKKYWVIILIIILCLLGGLFFYKKSIKNSKIGNNKNSQEIIDYILNLSSYETKIEVEIVSNKNNNENNYEIDENKIIMKVMNNSNNQYTKQKVLYIDKNTQQPIKMEIKDNKQKNRINILYKEVKINI